MSWVLETLSLCFLNVLLLLYRDSAWVNMSLALEKAQSESGGLTNGVLKRLLNDCRVPISDVV